MHKFTLGFHREFFVSRPEFVRVFAFGHLGNGGGGALVGLLAIIVIACLILSAGKKS